MSLRKIPRLAIELSSLFVCDIQDRFRPLIWRAETVIRRSSLLYSAAQYLNIPTIITEQYPKAFGNTVSDIFSFTPISVDEKPATKVFEKKLFSMMTDEVNDYYKECAGFGTERWERQQVILCGIETHVCVMQTALDLLADGKEVISCFSSCSYSHYIND